MIFIALISFAKVNSFFLSLFTPPSFSFFLHFCMFYHWMVGNEQFVFFVFLLFFR